MSELLICVGYDDYHAIEIVTVIISICAMIITILIIIDALIQFPLQKQIQISFKLLFYLCAIFAMITLITSITATILCVERQLRLAMISVSISMGSYFFLLLTLLTTLIARLKFTFEGSIYELSNTESYLFLTFYTVSILFILSALGFLEYWTYSQYHHEAPIISAILCLVCACVGGMFYLFTAIWACYIFANNLMKVADSGGESMRTIPGNDENDSITGFELNDTQNKLIESVSRYVSLFTIATITSAITIIVLSSGKWTGEIYVFHVQIFMIISSVDTVLNLICLYLQYKFNVKYYEKYCQCLEQCWKPYFIKKTKLNMYRTYEKKKSELTPLETENQQLKGTELDDDRF